MKVCEATISELDTISAQQNLSQFLQSGKWQKVEELDGSATKVFKVIDERQQTVAIGLFVKKNLFSKKYYWYCPRGPIFILEDSRQEVVTALKDYFFEDKDCLFIRVEPTQKIEELNSLKLVKEIQPQHTLVIDLEKSEEEILSGMHQKTRYNIHLAERSDVQIEKINSEENLRIFWWLSQDTAKRQGISIHSLKHYHNIWDGFGNGFYLLVAHHNGNHLATGMFVHWGNTLVYLHGASADEYKELMAPYLIQWEAIKLAKKLGCKYYDFYGVAPDYHSSQTLEFNNFFYNKNHPWAGVSRFKFGFGGKRIDFTGTFDLILNSFWYKLYQFLRFINLTFRKIWKKK